MTDALAIEPAEGLRTYYPGEEITGEVAWSLDVPPASAELRLFWYTSGRGRRDLRVVQTVTFPHPGQQDRREFSVTLPDSPYSFRGKLITLTWALELVVTPGERSTQLEIVMSPTASLVMLERPAD